MKFLMAIVLVTTMAAGGDGFDAHGNNPKALNEVEVNQLVWAAAVMPDAWSIYAGWRWPDVALSKLTECIEGAQEGCGDTGICSVCVCNGACSFICRDYFGHCPDNPPACCPTKSLQQQGENPINF